MRKKLCLRWEKRAQDLKFAISRYSVIEYDYSTRCTETSENYRAGADGCCFENTVRYA